MKRVKTIKAKQLNEIDRIAYHEYLKKFLDQDISIISIKETASGTGNYVFYTTIVYECNEDFIDKTGADYVILKDKFMKKGEYELVVSEVKEKIVNIRYVENNK